MKPLAHDPLKGEIRLGTPVLQAIWIGPAAGSREEQYISSCFQSAFTGANRHAGFSPCYAIGWYNTITTGTRRKAAITPLVLKKKKAASPDQRAIHDWAWSGNYQANTNTHSCVYTQRETYTYTKAHEHTHNRYNLGSFFVFRLFLSSVV